jgi:hypothetical protein
MLKLLIGIASGVLLLSTPLAAQTRQADIENEAVALEIAEWGMPVVTFFAEGG